MGTFSLLCITATLFFSSSFASQITPSQMNQSLSELWSAAMRGDASKYHSLLASNVVVITNGEEDDAPWQQESFVKGLFGKVRYYDMRLTTPVGIDTTTRSIIGHYQWKIVILTTGQDIDMGQWSTQVTFDSAGKISRLTNIGPARPLAILAQALSSKKDARDTVESFISAMNSGNAANVQKLLSRDFEYASNGEHYEDWGRNLRSWFAKARWTIKLLDLATAGPGEALANVEALVQAGSKSVTSLQGWHVTFNATAETLSSIDVIQDSLAAYETDQLLGN